MAKFTVIDGGNQPTDFEAFEARRHLYRLIVEILRAVARGDDPSLRVARELVEFSEHAARSRTSLSDIVDDVIQRLHKNLVSEQADNYRDELEDILLASVQVIAETCADDGFAAGRASQRQTVLRAAIDRHVVGRERRSRESGWSFVRNLLDENFPPTRKPPRGRRPR